MRILITGSTGQLGQELRKILNEDELLTPTHNQIDIRDPKILPKIIGLKPDIIIHTAAYTDVDGCEVNNELAWNVNSLGTRNVATAAEELKAKLFYISTDYIFDGKKKDAYVENDEPNPLNVYGKSKLMGENFIRDITSRYCIVRTSWLYGKKGNNFVHTILEQVKVKEELRVVHDQIGSPTYTKDLGQVIKKLIPIEANGIYHASGEGQCSWYDFTLEILRLIGTDKKVVPITSNEISRLAIRPPYSALRNLCLREIGIFMPPWQEALRDFFLETEI